MRAKDSDRDAIMFGNIWLKIPNFVKKSTKRFASV